MKFFRSEIHGHVIEARHGDWGGQSVLLDGRLVSRKPLAGWMPQDSHFLEIDDEQGRRRCVEVRFEVPSLGIGKTRVCISVDGVERTRIEPLSDSRKPRVCPQCGYGLVGLPIDHGEVRCPECGRHIAANLVDLTTRDPTKRGDNATHAEG